MLICYVTIQLLRQTCLLISFIVAYLCSCSRHMVNDFSWTHCASCLFNTTWFLHTLLLIGWHFWHTHQTRETLSQTPLYTVSRKHVIQHGNQSKTLGLNVLQFYEIVTQLSGILHSDWPVVALGGQTFSFILFDQFYGIFTQLFCIFDSDGSILALLFWIYFARFSGNWLPHSWVHFNWTMR